MNDLKFFLGVGRGSGVLRFRFCKLFALVDWNCLRDWTEPVELLGAEKLHVVRADAHSRYDLSEIGAKNRGRVLKFTCRIICELVLLAKILQKRGDLIRQGEGEKFNHFDRRDA